MIKGKSFKFLEALLQCSGPSGFEEETAAVYRDYLGEFCDEVYTDVMGNTAGVLNQNAEFKVMLAGHYDEIGFQVVYIADDGLIYFRPNGGIDKLTVPGSEIEILTKSGRLPGVIGKKPIHMLKPKERDQAVELTDMWIDIGAESNEEAKALVRIGDPVAFKSNFTRLGKNRIKSKGMDDKIGAFVVAEVLKVLSKKNLNVAVYGVGTVQEELGLRGATTSSFDIDPDVGFAIDVGFTTDLPDMPKKELGDIAMGNGPEVNRSADNNQVLGERLRAVAKRCKIKYQESPGHRASGGTDTATIQLSRSGVATALISIPNRYMHTQVEICDLRDVEGAIKLLSTTIAEFAGTESFIPGLD